MTTHTNNVSFFNRLRVGAKIAIIPLFFICALAAIITYTITTLEEQKVDSQLIEFIGRQRMLNQKNLGDAVMVSEGLVPKEQWDYTRKVWLETQDSFINGGAVVYALGQA